MRNTQLTLTKETLQALNQDQVMHVEGGAIIGSVAAMCNTQPYSVCACGHSKPAVCPSLG